ncbi:MAG: class I SAM-dependent methyltransferase [bacterium]|nr:class I SAM-dependent methyltransferase [bacterium]
MDTFTARTTCRVCNFSTLTPILSLGDLHPSDFVDAANAQNAVKAPLELMLCNNADGGCGLLQLRHTVPHESMYRNYWYRSGINKTMTDELGSITSAAKEMVALASGDFVVDIGSNDGTLLRSYNVPGLNLVGFEPARNIVEKYGSNGITRIFNDFFNFGAWHEEFGKKKAKVITAIAMFYDLEDPNAFVADVRAILDKDGLFIIQMAHVPLVIERNAFDGICHEHLELYSLLALENLLKRHDLEIFDVALRDINEGSIRAYIRHKGSSITSEGGLERVQALREEEKKLGLHEKKVYEDFVARVKGIKHKTRDFIEAEVRKGKKVYVYGASTKGNTLLQYFDLDNTLITAAAERNPDKWGKKTVGTLIPIISEEQARKEKPDYFLVLPWHFLKEFKEREKAYFAGGGKFIVPLPNLELVGYENDRLVHRAL